MKIFTLMIMLNFGIIPNGHLKLYESRNNIRNEMSMFGDFNIEARMFNNHFFYGIDSKIFIWKTDSGYDFSPDRIDFLFFTGIRFNEHLEIYWKHFCQHPIIPWINSGYDYSIFESSYNEIGIQFKTELFAGEK